MIHSILLTFNIPRMDATNPSLRRTSDSAFLIRIDRDHGHEYSFIRFSPFVFIRLDSWTNSFFVKFGCGYAALGHPERRLYSADGEGSGLCGRGK
jgi:hypothetical protein